jgi:hypothetical protein
VNIELNVVERSKGRMMYSNELNKAMRISKAFFFFLIESTMDRRLPSF